MIVGNEKKGSGLVGLDVFRSILRPAYVTVRSTSGPFFFVVGMVDGGVLCKSALNREGSDEGLSLRNLFAARGSARRRLTNPRNTQAGRYRPEARDRSAANPARRASIDWRPARPWS